MILLIDNYDSFVYNLYQYFKILGESVQVFRNDKISIAQIRVMNPQAIVLSPGPCTPCESGMCIEIIQTFGALIPILGVCLGHQSIAYAWGTKIKKMDRVMHAKTSLITHCNEGIFQGITNPLKAMRYHSLVVDKETLSEDFIVTATSLDDNQIMAISHKKFHLQGIQFHPESIMTPQGLMILENFLRHVQ